MIQIAALIPIQAKIKHCLKIILVGVIVLLPACPLAQTASPALAILKAAAEKGEAQAQSQLGDVYHKKMDQVSALQWYRKVAAQGVAHAQSEAGRILIAFAQSPAAKPAIQVEHGEEAIQWLVKAAAQGEQAAQLELGKQFLSGKFIRQDQVDAYKWFSIAATGGNPIAPKQLEAKWAQDAIILELSQKQIAEGQKRIAAFEPNQKAEVPEPAWANKIKLQGLSGAAPKRLAIINGQTFQKGERAEIKAGNKKVAIKCLEIGPGSATIEIEGLEQSRELKWIFPK